MGKVHAHAKGRSHKIAITAGIGRWSELDSALRRLTRPVPNRDGFRDDNLIDEWENAQGGVLPLGSTLILRRSLGSHYG